VLKTSTPEILVYLSTLRGTGSNYPIAITQAVNGSASLGSKLATGDLDGDGFEDLVISDYAALSSSGGANGGGVYVYYGRDDSASGSPWWSAAPVDDDHPSIAADQVLLGATGSRSGIYVALANVDGNVGDELMVTVPFDSTFTNAVFGFTGGDRSSFGGTKVDMNPDFSITGYAAATSTYFVFGYQVLGADMNGDGIDDLVIGDFNYEHSTTNHAGSTGEIYVFTGGSIEGTQSLSAPTSLMHTIRYDEPGSFGYSVAKLDRPKADDAADWLAISYAGADDNVIIFKGTDGSSSGAGYLEDNYPVDGLAGITYETLDKADWSGVTNYPKFGDQLSAVNLGTNSLIVSCGQDSGPIYQYVYDAGANTLKKTAVIPGNSNGHGYRIAGATVNGESSLLILDKTSYDTLRVR
jgi:hypothetical protein